jgi:hypothetical protein
MHFQWLGMVIKLYSESREKNALLKLVAAFGLVPASGIRASPAAPKTGL